MGEQVEPSESVKAKAFPIRCPMHSFHVSFYNQLVNISNASPSSVGGSCKLIESKEARTSNP